MKIFSINKFCLFFFGFFLFTQANVRATTYTWTGNNSSNWFDMGNWNPSTGVPGSGDEAIINSGLASLGSGNVSLSGLQIMGGQLNVPSSASLTLNGTSSINAGGTIDIGGTVILNTNLDVQGDLIFGVGSIEGSGDLTISGTMTWNSTSASVKVTGQFMNTGTINIDGGANLKTELTNSGTINQTGNILFGDNSDLINLSVYDFKGNGDVAVVGNHGNIMNQGTIKKTGGSGASDITADLNNNGTIDAQIGKIKLSGRGIHGGDFMSNGSGVVSLSNRDTLVGGNTFGGSGTTSIDGSGVFLQANCSATNLKITQGTISGDGDLTVSGHFEWSGGSLGDANHPTGSINLNGTFLINGGDILEGELINNASTTWTSGNWVVGDLALFTNNSTMDIQTNADIFRVGSPTNFVNHGTITKSSGTGTTVFNIHIHNTGTINVNSGEIRFPYGGLNSGDLFIASGADVTVAGGDPFINRPTGAIEGNGDFTVSGSLINNGFFRPGSSPGTLMFNSGSIICSDTTVFEMEIGGDTLGTNYDHIIFGSTVTLDGTLLIQMINGFVPNVGDTFVLIDYNNINGTWFDNVTTCAGRHDRRFEIYDTGSEIIAVTFARDPFITSTSICSGDSIFLGNAFQSSAGIYYDTVNTVQGCDSLIETTLSVNTLDTMVTQNGLSLMANASGANYQWLDCGNNNAIISGETNQTFTVTSSGSYSVVVTDNNCLDTSSCIQVTVTSINDHINDSRFNIYPNPTEGGINVLFNNIEQHTKIIVLNTLGEKVIERLLVDERRAFLDLSHLESGIYFLQTVNTDYKKTVKIIKE